MRLLLVAGVLAVTPPAAADEQAAAAAQGYRLEVRSIAGCEGLPFARAARELWIEDAVAVDPHARFWMLDRPAHYDAHTATTRYRVGSGAIRVDARLTRDLTEETVKIWVERPIGPAHLAAYLPRLQLPCERTVRYAVERSPSREIDLDPLIRFDANLHEATELLYDDQFRAAERKLLEARRLRPEQPASYWMMARLRYLELESLADTLSAEDRIHGYEEAERFADEAVARAPNEPEGYLWQAIARGRIVTARGNLRAALSAMVGGRGPGWIEWTLRRAVELPETFHFFGDSTRGDALYALAQFYRLAPDAWYMAALGARGDLSRSIDLLREAVSRQPERLEYRKELAIALLCRGRGDDRQTARRELEALLELPALTPIDLIDRAHAERLLAEVPANVCGYSRDGFVEFTP